MRIKILVLIILTMTITVLSAPSAENIALGKPVESPFLTESRSEAGNITKSNAEGWVTKSGQQNVHAIIDLEKEHALNSISLKLNEATLESTAWSVWVSSDAVIWQKVFTQDRTALLPETWVITIQTELSGRYIKLQSDGGARFGMQEIQVFGAPVCAITKVTQDGENLSVSTTGAGVVFVTLLDENNKIQGVYFAPGSADFRIRITEKTKSLKINLLKDIETMEPLDSVKINL